MDKYLQLAKSKVSAKRYIHIEGVYEMATLISKKYNINTEKCQIAAILHDIAKEDKNLNTIEIISKLTDDKLIINSPNLWHSFTGAMFAQETLNIQDNDIIEAIKYHTIASENLSDVGKVVFISDVIEKNRTNQESVALRESFLNNNLSFNNLIKGACEIKLNYGKKKHIKIHPNLQKMYEKLK